jgi:hypothetical protein
MDLFKCFDRLDHGLILAKVNRLVKDGNILKWFCEQDEPGAVSPIHLTGRFV